MLSAHRRKKQPELVRKALEESAMSIALTQGVNQITVQAVSDAAGVSKGAFMHHYPNKQALLKEVFDNALARLDNIIESHISADPIFHGRFTRAYINAVFDDFHDVRELSKHYTFLSAVSLADKTLAINWYGWFSSRLIKYASSDDEELLSIIRYAVDGVWLSAALVGGGVSDVDLRSRLTKMTYSL